VAKPALSTRLLTVALIILSLLALPGCRRKSPDPVIPAADVSERGMQLPFTKVERLSRPALFVTFHKWLEHMDVSEDADLNTDTRISQALVGSGIAVKPDGSGFYAATKTDLIQFDNRAKLVRKIPIVGFDLGMGRLTNVAGMSDDYIWLMSDDGTGGQAVVEWRLDSPPATRQVVPVEYSAFIAVDRNTRKVYVPVAGGLIDFRKAQFEDAPWGMRGEYFFADFDSSRGLLLSTYPSGEWRGIVHVDLRTGKRNRLDEGSYAVWGPDDWIYFCVGDTELWRCKSDGSLREVVFTATHDRFVAVGGFAVAPRFDGTRSRLAYTYYRMARDGSPTSGIVFIDFETQEYHILHDKYRYNFAWVVDVRRPGSQPLQP